MLRSSLNKNSSDYNLSDIYDGEIWKTFPEQCNLPGCDPFFAHNKLDEHLGLAISLDWFQPFDKSPYSTGVLYAAILNLPREERFKTENMLLLGLLPGPHEVRLHSINYYLAPIIDELLILWNGGRLPATQNRPEGKYIRAAVILCSCDIPAARKLIGHAGANVKCHRCLKRATWDRDLQKMTFGGFHDMDEWFQDTDPDRHRAAAVVWKQCSNNAERTRHVKETGVRWSELLRLPYFNPIRHLVVDPMHNLFLGLAKWIVMDIWLEEGKLSKQNLRTIQDRMDKIRPPPDIGRIPRKVAAGNGFSHFTADQWKTFILVYATTVLWDFLDDNDRYILATFVRACRLLVCRILPKSHLEEVQTLLVSLVKKIERVYGKGKITPNLHLSLHLTQCCFDYGPLYSFWCYSYERMNGLLGNDDLGYLIKFRLIIS